MSATHAKLEAAVQKCNQRIDAYWDKKNTLEAIATQIRQMIDPSGHGVKEVLSTMSEIESMLEQVHEHFEEDGAFAPDGGDFDIDGYRWMRIERDVANRKIRELEEIPEEFRDEFKHLFDGSEHGERPRDTEAIRIDLGDLIEVLGCCLDRVDYFTDYLPPGRKRSSPQLDALREKLDCLWDDFKVAAKTLAYHF